MAWRRGLAGGALLVLAGVAALLVWRFGWGHDVRAAVAAAGAWAPLLFVGVHSLVTVSPFPRTIFTIAAGALFGTTAGLLLTVAATVVSAAGAFWLVRLAGSELVERYAPRGVVDWVGSRVERRGLLAVVSLRLIPALPFSVVNYASALSGVRFPPFLVGTLFGVLPGTVAIVVLGDAALGGDPPPALLAVSVAGALVGVVGVVVAARRPAPFTDERDSRTNLTDESPARRSRFSPDP
ncbi:MAG: TVP38/TMEM64 family protein [Pseudonocardia sp.]|nr:TVP38/TMEM64 family protein [Pseudonocardia sp.]